MRQRSCILIPLLTVGVIALFDVLAEHAYSSGGVLSPDAALILKAKPVDIGSQETDLDRLLKHRYNAALRATQLVTKEVIGGRRNPIEILPLASMLLDSKLELARDRKDRLVVLETHVQFMRYIDAFTMARFGVGNCSEVDCERVRYFLFDAQIRLQRAKNEVK